MLHICLYIDSALGVTGIHTAGTTRILHKRKKLFAVPCYDGEKTLASANEDILNLHQESETPPDPGEEDGLNQRLESEIQQDPELRQKDDLNWKQESATQRDPELEETDLPKDGVNQGQESQTPQAPKLGVKVGVNQEQKRETQGAPAPGEKDGLTLEQESATQQDSEPREREFPTVFQLEKDSQHAVDPKTGELRASQSSPSNGISSHLSNAVWLIVTTCSSYGRENENPERATAMACSETPEREVEDEATCPIYFILATQ
ncbi:uncharacterized protein LOC135978927 [Chrysemys picta bellii]|uniref:uncharacterized protein LOC135978927 n=1 Tax=Chrysemys picta bellii TaxID=8478 RepID=UPI0032B2BF0C